ncbi:KinB-signaling pathway activation protein [Pseudogracilibacillus sp. SO30301A]|uniref:KinB-signaling pathway activation protein n=1 Tax=Pseudogracilibacillus sp. SO30301A TaxID=3098291 RepID=UPI00300DD7C0
MNSRKVVSMFFRTILIGGLVGFVTSFFVKSKEYANVLQPFDGMELLGIVLFFIGMALVFTVISQTGFFAYLFIHRFGQNFFRSFWPTVQVLLILFALFDLVYLSYSAGKGEISLLFYIIMTAVILIYGIIIARLKVKQTNRTGFIPALFVMIVITALELSLALRAVDVDYIILMLTPLLAANSYQVLALHEVTKRDEAHIKRIEERRKVRQLKKQKPIEKPQ